MMKREIREKTYNEILRRLWNGDYLTKASRGLVSEVGGRRFYRELETTGILTFDTLKASRKVAKFTPKGIELLQTKNIINDKLEMVSLW